MLDSRYLRADIEEAAQRLATRNYKLDVEKINQLESLRKEYMTKTQDLQAQRNSLSKSIGQAIKMLPRLRLRLLQLVKSFPQLR